MAKSKSVQTDTAALGSPASQKALYRKYRPTKLEDVVGQDQVITPLRNAINQGKIAHAYLFIGPRGTGKTSVARIFAHAVNHFNYQVEDSYLDIIEIDAASNTGVDNIRELREKAVIAPTKGKYKVYIIDEVHMLTKSASNALLKTLEEPPAHVIFIMATTDAHKVPITISSRTQVHTFRLADPETMLKHLRAISDAEQIPITDDALKIVVERGDGSFRDSLSLLDQIATLSTDTITAELLTSTLGLPQSSQLSALLSAYAERNFSTIHNLLKDLLNTGIKPEIIASELISRIITSPSPDLLPLLSKLPEVQPPFPEAKLLLALLQPSLESPSSTRAPINPSSSHMSTPATPTPSPTTLRSIPNSRSNVEPESNTIPEATPTPKPNTKTNATPESDSVPVSSPAGYSSQPFAWDDFLDQLRETNEALYAQLQKIDHEYDNNTLHLYPQSKFVKTLLEKPRNHQILLDSLGGIALNIHDLSEKQPQKDPMLSQISAIMGDVREINEDLPF